jgi:hypothetical protein
LVFFSSPRFAWGGVRVADGGVMIVVAQSHDPSGPSGHLPTAWGGRGFDVP